MMPTPRAPGFSPSRRRGTRHSSRRRDRPGCPNADAWSATDGQWSPARSISAFTFQNGLFGSSPSLPSPRLNPVPTGSMKTRSVKSSQVDGLSIRCSGGFGTAPSVPARGSGARAAPRCRNTAAAPGPPLKKNATGRVCPGPEFGEIGDREDRRCRGSLGIGQRDRLGDGAVIELALAELDGVVGLDVLRERRSGRQFGVGRGRIRIAGRISARSETCRRKQQQSHDEANRLPEVNDPHANLAPPTPIGSGYNGARHTPPLPVLAPWRRIGD